MVDAPARSSGVTIFSGSIRLTQRLGTLEKFCSQANGSWEMNIRTKIRPTVSSLVLAIAASLSTSAVADHTLEFEELKVLIEMNATDGDVGFHALADAGPWWWMRLDDPNLVKLLTIKALKLKSVIRERPMRCEPPFDHPGLYGKGFYAAHTRHSLHQQYVVML